jgi:uncharacterized membrane protein
MTAYTLLRGLWLFVALVWLVAVVRRDALGEWHHAYAGALLTVAGLVLAHWLARPGLLLAYLGLLVAADDAWQQAYRWANDTPYYRSPLVVLSRRHIRRLPRRAQR